MGKIRRGGYIFITLLGDPEPKHVHVFKSGVEILKWDLESGLVMRGKFNRKIIQIIEQLVVEGVL